MDELDWPTSAGWPVQGAAETRGLPSVAAAASRLPDDATFLGIDELWRGPRPPSSRDRAQRLIEQRLIEQRLIEQRLISPRIPRRSQPWAPTSPRPSTCRPTSRPRSASWRSGSTSDEWGPDLRTRGAAHRRPRRPGVAVPHGDVRRGRSGTSRSSTASRSTSRTNGSCCAARPTASPPSTPSPSSPSRAVRASPTTRRWTTDATGLGRRHGHAAVQAGRQARRRSGAAGPSRRGLTHRAVVRGVRSRRTPRRPCSSCSPSTCSPLDLVGLDRATLADRLVGALRGVVAGLGLHLAVDLRAKQDAEGAQEQPEVEDDDTGERAVGGRVAAERRHVERERERAEQPQDGGDQRARRDPGPARGRRGAVRGGRPRRARRGTAGRAARSGRPGRPPVRRSTARSCPAQRG